MIHFIGLVRCTCKVNVDFDLAMRTVTPSDFQPPVTMVILRVIDMITH